MVFLIPVYLLIVAIEFLYARRKGLKVYDEHEFFSHLLTGVGQQVFNLFWFAGLIALYQGILDRFSIMTISTNSAPAWIALFFLTDFAWYVGHRLSHRMNFFVASHATHHQAEDFNHASALRQSWSSRPAMFLVFLPLALLGFPPLMVLGCQVVSAFLQFFSHNGIVERHLGWIEYVFITPRSHRVHHGTNVPYLDKNYGGVFSFWDRWFGTYQDRIEEIPIRIGALSKFEHRDPFEANWNPYRRIFFALKRRSGIWPKIRVWFERPEDLDRELKALGYAEVRPSATRRTLDRPDRVRIYGLFALATGAVVFLLTRAHALNGVTQVSLGLFVLWLVSRIGSILVTPLSSSQSSPPTEGFHEVRTSIPLRS